MIFLVIYIVGVVVFAFVLTTDGGCDSELAIVWPLLLPLAVLAVPVRLGVWLAQRYRIWQAGRKRG